MSTKISLKHQYETGVGGFHLYRECLEEDDKYVYLTLDGVPFWAASTAAIYTDEGLSSISFRLPFEWARKLGLIENPPAPNDKLKGTIRDLMDNDIQPAEGDRDRQSQKLAAWFLAPNGWIAKPGPDGPTPVAPIDALDRPEDVINALKKRQGTHDA